MTTGDSEPRTLDRCVSADEAASVNGTVESARASSEKKALKSNCKVKAFAIANDVVTYTLGCGARTIESTTRFQGESSEGTLTTTAEGKSVVTRIKAHRTGACH